MHDLRIRITESDGIRYATGANPYASTLYVGENIPEALDAILEGLQSFRDIPAMVRALHSCPEFCQLAAAVHGLHLAESDATPVDEAIAILTKLRDSRQPEAIRTRAGNLLIDIAEDDRAVCDASSMDDRPGQDAGAALVGVECYVHWKRVDERTAHVIETPPTKMIVDEYSCDGYVGIYRSKAGSLEGWSTGNVAYRATPKATP